MGEVSYHIPAQTANPVASGIRIRDIPTSESHFGSRATLELEAPIKLLDLGKYIVKRTEIGSPWPMSKPLEQFYSRSTFTDGAAVIAYKPFVMARADSGAAVGWIAVDEGVLPTHEPMFAVCFSGNEVNGKFDGFNVLIVGERDGKGGGLKRHLVRLGIGEIQEEGWFDGASLERIWVK
ncbi:unnamed protein product [Parascedosporium putredinis]|uniref:Uncharacterized protein n=1 Tax=Parascedosporium putredinis TaxID=1442378 RepID=A0A9P1H3F9_9PEZI|nr:unnamed protein product [Parascedosporium putredinis]CAI7997008.1 unnamed protein product [Parascedosporium putredinis]